MRLIFAALLLLIGCRSLTILVDDVNPFEPIPTATQPPAYRVIGTVRAKNSVLNVRGCRIVSNTVCPVVTTLRGAERLPVVDILDAGVIDSDVEWYYVALDDGLAFAWVAKYASIYEAAR